ncbi:MAG: citrate/2-methylcitrate synthase [Candidatus Parvarchaeum sp.]
MVKSDKKINAPQKAGLEGIIAGDTNISYIDGINGKLYYRGYSINDIATNCSFEETSFLLIYGYLPNEKELYLFSKNLKRKRQLPEHIIKMINTFTKNMSSMEALRTVVSSLSSNDKDARFSSIEEKRETGISIIAKMPTIVAYHHRIKNSKKIIKSNPKLGHAANFLYMLNGEIPTDDKAEILDKDFVLHAEHGFNASSFSVRVTISTFSDIHSAYTTGIGTLKGPLHGGAASEVLSMLNEIKTPNNVENYVNKKLLSHGRIMGYGHRIYKTYDPRAKILKNMANNLSKNKNDNAFMQIGNKLEKIMADKKNIYPNVDFYSAIVYHTLNLKNELYSPIFAIARSSGWLAHILEQYQNNRLIRPLENYTGKLDNNFIEINKRK